MKLAFPALNQPGFKTCLTLSLLIAAGGTAVRADSVWQGGTNILSASNWSPSGVPAAGTNADFGSNASSDTGWNSHGSATSVTIGDLNFISGSPKLTIGAYASSGSAASADITLGGATLNSLTDTIISNATTHTVAFENDVEPSGDTGANAETTFTLEYTNSYIQMSGSSNIVIDNVIIGAAGDGITVYGDGNGTTTGSVLELGAGSTNDVINGAGANVTGNAGTFTGGATVETSDSNSFTGGITIGDTAGTANAAILQVDGANALPNTGGITVNTNSQLELNGNANYGGSGQSLTLNGLGNATTTGALVTTSGDNAAWVGTINANSNTDINVRGSGGSLVLQGAISGSGQIQKNGAGALDLSVASSSFSGGWNVANGSVVAENANALGTGAVEVTAGALSSTVGTANMGALSLMTTGTLQVDQTTFSISTGQNFTMSGGTFDLTDSSGSVGEIEGAGSGTFSITGGTLDLGGNTWNYSNTYDILNGFASGSVSGLTITDFDTTDYNANLSSSGVLSFTAVPEPGTIGTVALGTALLLVVSGRMRRGLRRA
jgi:hypothetical protein